MRWIACLLLLTATASWTFAAEGDRPRARKGPPQARDGIPPPPPPGEGQEPQGGPGERRRPMPPPPPLMGILDTDHDGELSAEEIDAASDALAKLDKNGDGKLDRHELRPPMPRPDRDGQEGPPPHPDGTPPPPRDEGGKKDF